MKRILIIVYFLCILHVVNACVNQQGEQDANEVIKQLFYENGEIWNGTENTEMLSGKLIPMYKKYCSQKFFRELNDELKRMGVDHDLITCDYGFSKESIETFSIEPLKKGKYRVTYNVVMDDYLGGKVKTHAILMVTIIKEDNTLKVMNIEDIGL